MDIERQLNAAVRDLGRVLATHGLDLDGDALRAFKARSADLDRLLAGAGIDISALEGEMKFSTTGLPTGFRHPVREAKSLGEAFVNSPAYLNKGGSSELPIELKTLFQTSAGWPPESLRSDLVVESAQRPIQLLDLIPTVNTNQAAYVYMEETGFTNAAAETAEGGAFPEATLALTQRTATVQKLATFLPVTDEQLADVAQARQYVDSRLVFMLRQRLDYQVLNGDGVAPNLRGILNTSGIQTQARGTDPQIDAIRKAADKVRLTGRAQPTAVVLHPNDAQTIALTRTADGLYIFGTPSGPGPDRVWGLPIVITDAIAQGTGLVGDFTRFSLLAVRQGVEVEVSNAHADYFTTGKLAIRATIRVAFAATRPGAFCTITGL